ncbi:carbohydrate esterase family 9 protein [Polychaeton citri CBS 116435]|uniref:N-acetylglucosamine-6-phosphate deacetylase n=1 Tax=Polychaeton citri CBS 116435 TaxID=1314669 RepID=A0A9P4Q1J9_9PEZI|nr:carbohydrate esterase family 9 protein [Polychaeton citri CBS 116435]
MSGWFTSFFNCRLLRNGEIVEGERLVVSDDTGLILEETGYIGGDAVDLEDAIIAPGFLELQTNGLNGFHFTHFEDEASYANKIDEVAKFLPQTGVTGFYATLPTVQAEEFAKILPSLKPREIYDGASLLGAHAEGPYLHPSKKGAHNATLFHDPSTTGPVQVYGPSGQSSSTLKLVTLAPELPGADGLIRDLAGNGTRVALGHSSASYDQGLAAIKAGATCLTHTLNAMAPLHHRDPGLAGLITSPTSSATTPPYYSIIPDGHHLHPSVATMLFRASPDRCILVTDSVELAGLPDGTYPGHAQIAHAQTKAGSRVTIAGTDTLVGGCATLDQCVQNLMRWSGCGVAEAVRCVTENVADLMGDTTRGRLEAGRRADLVVLEDDGTVRETWVAGRKVWEKR